MPPPTSRSPTTYGRAATSIRALQSEKAAEGVWYLTGGTHHSVVIEMSDHLIIARGPPQRRPCSGRHCRGANSCPASPSSLDRQPSPLRPLGGRARVRGRGRDDPHAGRKPLVLRTHPRDPGHGGPDHLAKSGKKATVEGVRARWVLGDATRTVEIRHIAGIQHADDMLMVYLPKEKFLIQADAYTPPRRTRRP